jgi:predicted enzyme related to lactoylglutathione lyase
VLNVEFAEERHGDGPIHLNAMFGEWSTPSWFLMSLRPNPDRAGTVDIGFLVEDVDRVYERALGAGAGDVSGPRDVEGMPRNARVTDPSGSHIGLSTKAERVASGTQRGARHYKVAITLGFT